MKKNNKIKKAFLLGIIFILISVIITPATIIVKSNEKTNDCDIPTWYDGDEWMYIADPVYYSGEFGSFSGTIVDLKQKVLGITDIIHNEIQYEVYEIKITGNIAGIFTYNEISGDLEGDVIGTSYIRISDLAQLKTDIYSYGTIQIIFITLDYEASFLTNLFPPLELYDFPINVDEQWIISCDSVSSGSFYLEGIVNESFSGNMSINEYMECEQQENVNVPAGSFDCYKLSRTNNSIWYSTEVENSVKSVIDINDENNTFLATLSLKSFTRSTQPITITLDIEPYQTLPNETVIISGQATESNTGNPVQNENIIIEIPATGDNWTVTTNSDGEYTKTITAPLISDDTPALNEIGSDGVVAKCILNNIRSHRVKTIVIIENNAPDNPTITGETNGKVGEEYEYLFIATDSDDNDVWFYIDWGDDTYEEWIGPYESGEEVYVSHTWDEEGTYNIRAKAKDTFDSESDWTTLEVIMPINQPLIKQLLFRFFERFPNIFPMIRNLFGL